EAICDVPEYYLTRAELAILRQHGPAIARALGTRLVLVELGSGSAVKTRLLLANLHEPVAYVPVDISPAALEATAAHHRDAFPEIPVHPVRGDFTRQLQLPEALARQGRAAVFFPGSTIGNFAP